MYKYIYIYLPQNTLQGRDMIIYGQKEKPSRNIILQHIGILSHHCSIFEAASMRFTNTNYMDTYPTMQRRFWSFKQPVVGLGTKYIIPHSKSLNWWCCWPNPSVDIYNLSTKWIGFTLFGKNMEKHMKSGEPVEGGRNPSSNQSCFSGKMMAFSWVDSKAKQEQCSLNLNHDSRRKGLRLNYQTSRILDW